MAKIFLRGGVFGKTLSILLVLTALALFNVGSGGFLSTPVAHASADTKEVSIPSSTTSLSQKSTLAPNFTISFNSIPVANFTPVDLLIMPCQDYVPANGGADPFVSCVCSSVYAVETATWYYPTADATISLPSSAYFSYIDPYQLILTIYNPSTNTKENTVYTPSKTPPAKERSL